MFSMRHKSADKKYPIKIGRKEINMLIESLPITLYQLPAILKQSNTKIFTNHSNASLEVLGIFKA